MNRHTMFKLQKTKDKETIFKKPTWRENTLSGSSKNKSYSAYLIQLSSVTQSCPTLCNLMGMDHNMPGFPVHNQLLEFA